MTWGIFKADSVSEAYKKMKAEELKGKQHKLDVDKDGKIEGEDLAKLRAQKEEVEQIDEGGQVAGKEQSVHSALRKSDVPAYLRKEKGEKPLTVADVKGPRKDSISHKDNLAKLRNEEVEELEELSKTTLQSYKKKATSDAKTSANRSAYGDPDDGDSRKVDGDRYDKRVKGIKTANARLNKEEVEQLDELSPGALKNYVQAAKDDVQNAKDERDSARSGGDGKGANDAYQRSKKRTAGIKQAKAKLNKEGLDIFSESEIDILISEVLKTSDDAGKWISDFVKSDDPRFSGDSKEQRKKRALAAYYAAQKKESVDYDSFLEEAVQGEIVKSGSKEIKHANVKDKDDEKDVMEPNSKGEADFLDKHSVKVTNDPAGEYKSGGEKLALAARPVGKGAGKYDGKNKTGIKEETSEDQSATSEEGSNSISEEKGESASHEAGEKRAGKKTYSTFKEKMNKGC